MPLSALDRLRLFLRPPGKGIHTFSTGAGYARPLLWALYGTDNPTQIQSSWEDSLQRIRRVSSILIGIPSDTGAGIMRGANFGPIGIREAYLQRYGNFPKGMVDVGDVLCVPQLLHDEMLSDRQCDATRRELYPNSNEKLPVSPLSVAEGALMAIHELNPEAQVFILGGDHSVTWPAMLYCAKRCGDDFGVLHFDAHTDLLEHRLGIRYCYTTWVYHALKLMKPHQFVQVGIRTTGKPKEYWTEKYPIMQVWANEVAGREAATITHIVGHFAEKGVRRIYISNDIDGTDASAAFATGTPEEGGLTPTFVKDLIAALRQEFAIIGGDVVEVAPPLSGRRDFGSEPTCVLAAEYLHGMFPSDKL